MARNKVTAFTNVIVIGTMTDDQFHRKYGKNGLMNKKAHASLKLQLSKLKWTKLTRACAEVAARCHLDHEVRNRVSAYILERDAEEIVSALE